MRLLLDLLHLERPGPPARADRPAQGAARSATRAVRGVHEIAMTSRRRARKRTRVSVCDRNRVRWSSTRFQSQGRLRRPAFARCARPSRRSTLHWCWRRTPTTSTPSASRCAACTNAGHELHLAVLTAGANGVDDGRRRRHARRQGGAARSRAARQLRLLRPARSTLRLPAAVAGPGSPRRRTSSVCAGTCWRCGRSSSSCRTATTAMPRTVAAYQSFCAIAAGERLSAAGLPEPGRQDARPCAATCTCPSTPDGRLEGPAAAPPPLAAAAQPAHARQRLRRACAAVEPRRSTASWGWTEPYAEVFELLRFADGVARDSGA